MQYVRCDAHDADNPDNKTQLYLPPPYYYDGESLPSLTLASTPILATKQNEYVFYLSLSAKVLFFTLNTNISHVKK